MGINANGGCGHRQYPGRRPRFGVGERDCAVSVRAGDGSAGGVEQRREDGDVVVLEDDHLLSEGSQPEEQNAAICVAQATDITGAPFVGETVCFFADFNAEDIQYFSGAIPGTSIVIGDEGRNEDAEDQGLRRICPFTDANGRAAVEIFNSNPTTVDVQALFVDEGILRHLIVPFPITGQVGPSSAVESGDDTEPAEPAEPAGWHAEPGTNEPDAKPA